MTRETGTGTGLNLFLGIITMVFLIGVVVMVFIIGNNGFKTSMATSESGSINNETILLSTVCQDTSVAGLDEVQLTGAVLRYSNGTIVPSNLYTTEGGCVRAVV